MSLLTLAEPDLVRACRILFGSDLRINRDFLEYIQLSGVKSAFRKRAIETHPDRVATEGDLIKSRHTTLFIEAQQAYRDLSLYLEAREKGFRLPPSPLFHPGYYHGHYPGEDFGSHWRGQKKRSRSQMQQPGNKPGNPPGDDGDRRFYHGPLPERHLLFGHFLYFSGEITWRMIIQAICWQRSQRPRLGQLGQRLGWLTSPDILDILRDRKSRQPFGEAAINLGLLDERQVRILLLQQQRQHKKIGEFFLEREILTPSQLDDLLFRCLRHNSRLQNYSARGRCESG
jgi:hypothetical protein